MKRCVAIICLLLCPPAFARFAALPIQDVVGQSVAVVDATIRNARTASYRFRDQSGVCGFIYEADIGESFKGGQSGTIVFASSEAMVPGSRRLLFLRSYAGDFPRDEQVAYPNGLGRARDACIASLPRLKSDFLHAAEFGYARYWPVSYSVRLSRWIHPLPELKARTIEVRQIALDGVPLNAAAWPHDQALPQDLFANHTLVEWTHLRQWLLSHAANIVDTSRTAAGCDETCIEQATRQTWDLQARLVESLYNWDTGGAGFTDALHRVRNAGSAYASRTCELFLLAWPDMKQRGAPAGSCSLRMAQQTTRELWMLRNAPESLNSYESGKDCDDACVGTALADATAALNQRVQDSQRSVDARGGSLSVEGSQDRWAAYMQAACAAIAAAWKEDNPDGPLSQRCRLRLTTSRLEDLGWLYLPSQ